MGWSPQKRRKYFKQCRNSNEVQFRYYFVKNLSQRGFNGTSEFDHEERNLTVDAIPLSSCPE